MAAAPSAPGLTDDRAQRAAAFDAAAASYDVDFSERRLGRWLRARVWRVFSETFTAGQHVLELGCGTGDDATWLAQRGVRVLATDGSEAMLRIAAAKVAARGLADRVRTTRVDLNALAGSSLGSFDGALTNFGALNCVSDRRALFEWLAASVRPGGKVVAVVMGPLCAWESAWYALHGQPRAAARRWHRAGVVACVPGAAVRVWYPSARTLGREAQPHFRVLRTQGIGTLLPPSYLADLVDRAPVVFSAAKRLDGHMPLGAWWADHYLALLERR